MRKYLFLLSAGLSFLFYFSILVVISPFIKDYKKRWIYGRLWAKEVLWAAGLQVDIEMKDDFEDVSPIIFASNHASQMDIPILYTIINKPMVFVVKKELFDVPLFGASLRLCGHIPIDRAGGKSALKSLQEAEKRLKDGISVVIFPEGTRSPDGALQEFKKGAMLLAEKSREIVVPVAIKGSYAIMPKGETEPKSGEVKLIFGKMLDPKELNVSKENRDEFSKTVRDAINEMLG
jgi:1-acyl-sn-glycerol-3-phosphate acyltransferase